MSTFKQQTEEIAKKQATEHHASLEVGGSYMIVNATVKAETGITSEINSTISKISKFEGLEEYEESGETQQNCRSHVYTV